MSASYVKRFRRYVDYTGKDVNVHYGAVFLQHPVLWFRAIFKRIRDQVLSGNEADAFVISALHDELRGRIASAASDVSLHQKLLAELVEAQNEVERLQTAASVEKSRHKAGIKQQLEDLSTHLGEALATVLNNP